APPPPPPPPAPHPPPPAPRPPPRPPPPRHCIAQSPSRSREGSNRLSHSSPESGSSTTAWNTASWISSPAYNICRGLPSSRKLGREATAALGCPRHYIPTSTEPRAIVKQAACAAAITSSGLVFPTRSSNR